MMKRQKKRICGIFCLLLGLITAGVLGLCLYYQAVLPTGFYADYSQKIHSVSGNRNLSIVPKSTGKAMTVCQSDLSAMKQEALVKLWGVIPVKTVELHLTGHRQMQAGGALFGIRLYTDGVLVIDLERVTTPAGKKAPAREAGLRAGDSILSVDGRKVTTNEELREIIAGGGGKPLRLLVLRRGEKLHLTLRPVCSASGVYRGGIWVRDSTAGIGTLTCFEEESGKFFGLGHGIYDTDAKTLLKLGEGEICKAELTGIQKGKEGKPGQLEGRFSHGEPRGRLLFNSECGIGGTLDAKALLQEQEGLSLPVAWKQDVRKGKVYLCSRLQERSVHLYEAEIEKLDLSDEKQSRNMVLRITDPELLAQTGGIVQGMSGSPIIQNGRLIGAVTHVFVNDPTRGYGIFIENMLEAAE